jgi:tRNA A37 threonylcarbamoyladenosine biosynthesis protein TsaE
VTLEQEAPGNATGNMSKQRQDALAAVERIVFQLTKPVVVALTGGWGEGKTHFWNEVV